MRQLSRYGQEFLFTEYGAKLHWVVERIKSETPEKYSDWLTQLQSIIPDLDDILIHERPEDHKKYVALRYNDGFEMPSGLMSEGLLRLLALTSLPYLPEKGFLCIIEEPENNLHPMALEIVIRNLHAISAGQVIMTTYSPFILGFCQAHEILIFSTDSQGSAQITIGSDHPGYSYLQGDSGLKTLFEMGELN
jgi:predicted ATPase